MIGRGTKPFNDRMDKHSADPKEHDRRIQAIEGKQEHSPTSQEVADLRVTDAKLDTQVRGLNEHIAGHCRTVYRTHRARGGRGNRVSGGVDIGSRRITTKTHLVTN